MPALRKLRVALAVMLVLLLSACGRSEVTQQTYQTHQIRGEAFGTTVELSIYGVSERRAHLLGGRILEEFGRLHRKFHAWKPSELTALNAALARGESYAADAEMVALLQAAAALSEKSDGLFNPAIGRLVRLWGFHTSEIQPQQPDPAELQRLVQAQPSMRDLVFDGTTVSSRNDVVMLDLGGYAKGYALDRAAQILRAKGVTTALINVGGNILALGQPGKRPWTVGIRDPRGEGVMAAVALRDNEAIGTSGDYQRYYMQNGKRRSHIVDPRSGETVDTVAAVTVITSGGSDAGTRSDGYTKPLFVAGINDWQALAQRMGMHEVMVVDTQGKVTMTPAMQKRMTMQHAAAN